MEKLYRDHHLSPFFKSYRQKLAERKYMSLDLRKLPEVMSEFLRKKKKRVLQIKAE
jgi:hypothetical protein